jgi:hypothetical protein
MLNEENSDFVFVGVDFEIDEISETRHDELSDISFQLPVSKPGKSPRVLAELRIACRTAFAAAGFRARM